MTSTTTPDSWQNALEDLVAGRHSASGDHDDAGAQLVVTDPDGTEVFRAPLARHHRIDPDQPNLLWLRPIVGGSPNPDVPTLYDYNLNVARRRALVWDRVEVGADGAVSFQLAPLGDEEQGQGARVEAADGEELETLSRWDDFVSRLSADDEAELDRLAADSWTGTAYS
ncbi:hypothetical protein [Kitasatospora sp. MBT66]|uniref:hypothetical protein n=1 Tax=Kitasatospora sp. MBT66 TaxID=1444769 RepID=UPI00068B2A8C|nr:hypothetical protein [Kitasatospora sp. MBT66]